MRSRGWAENPALTRTVHEVRVDMCNTECWPETPKTGEGGPRTDLTLVRDDGKKLRLWLDPKETEALHRQLGRAMVSLAKYKGEEIVHPAVEALRKYIAECEASPEENEDEADDHELTGVYAALTIVEKAVGA